MTPGASGFSFGGLDARVHLVWAVLLVVALAIRAERRRRAALRRLTTSEGAGATLTATTIRRRWRLGLLTGGLLLLVFASLQPRANPTKVRSEAQVRDLAIVIDVSRSMLAEDRKPNRLESVKLEIARLLDHLGGDRVGLIAFAGDAVIVCPLTSNYSYVKRTLRNVGPGTAGQGGTRIGDAMRKAMRDLLGLEPAAAAAEARPGKTTPDAVPRNIPRHGEGRFADLLLFTDGEDHDSFPGHAARQLRSLGIGLTIVGVGSPEGRTIPGPDGALQYRGELVRTSLKDQALRDLVLEAGRGRYLPASVHHFDLVDLYETAIRPEERHAVTQERVVWQEVFQPFVLGGLALVLLAFAFPIRPAATRRRREAA